jgi:hypothetical protein
MELVHQGDPLKLEQQAVLNLVRNRKLSDEFKCRNPVVVQHWRKGRMIGCYNTFNDITNEGKNLIFDVMFNNGTQVANNSWFIGLLNASGFTAVAATDVMSAHGGWTEFTSYTQTTRVAWGSGTASGQTVTNATPATFDINAGGTVKGVFIPSNSTKSGTTGKLWATALFGADVPVTNGDQLKITYTVSA